MKQVLIRQGGVSVEEVPTPSADPGTVLVRVAFSCISAGTELSGIQSSGMPLWKKALRNPRKAVNALNRVLSQGLAQTRAAIAGQGAGQPTGYSAAGEIVAVGPDVEGFAPGQRVACAGAQCAHHAEYIRVPLNLAVAFPDNLPLPVASTVTLGAIALQGLRRAQPTMGETFVVLGLGILGQIVTQLLKANGCRVIGMDLDAGRKDMALSLGMDLAVEAGADAPAEQAMRLTGGVGADGVIVTAASPSHEILSTAFKMCRKKGRVVLIGDVGLNLNRADIYQKELDFLVSTSYGPGRYDRRYEEEGVDYPVGYVRWTETRNMEEYLRLAAEGKISVAPLISGTFPVAQAAQAYQSFQSQSPRPMMVLLSYDAPALAETSRKVFIHPVTPARKGRAPVRIAVVGAGNFSKGMHLPNIAAMPDRLLLRAVSSRTGHNAAAVARQFGAAYATTRFEDVLEDADIDAVLIGTRHNLHALMALQALKAGKHVLLEKPLALNAGELESIRDFFRAQDPARPGPMLLTGFNRRFSPAVRRILEILRSRSNPLMIHYTMNAGYIPLEHWVHSPEGGGRNLGEACHIYDLFTCLTGSKWARAQATCLRPKTGYYSARDNFQATVAFEDGSIASLVYTALGSPLHPKERMEVFCDGKVLLLEDYRSLSVQGAAIGGFKSATPQKGQREELEAFADAVRDGKEWPSPLWQQLQATEIALEVERQLQPISPLAHLPEQASA